MSNYLSVTEYAKFYGKDPGNIRRLLSSGRLKGEKVGNQWIISKDAQYPKDERITTGAYHNSRKRASLNSHASLMNTINKMINDLRIIYGDLMQEVILYGSYARGTQTEESDVDIALILNSKPTKKKTNTMIDCVASHELECGKTLSVIDVDSNKYHQWQNTLPFYRNINKEGIVLWKATV